MSGLVVMTPDECSCWGDKIWITDNGGVRFENATEVTLDGVFTSEFDNYCVFINAEQSSSSSQLEMRLKKNTITPSTSGYAWQALRAQLWTEGEGTTTANGERNSTANVWRLGGVTNVMPSGLEVHVYGPHLSTEPTAMRSVAGSGVETGMLEDHAGTHSDPAAWDGFWLQRQGGTATITGNVIVMGYAE